MAEKRVRRNYSEDFKHRLVQLYNAGKPRIEIIREYDLTSSASDRMDNRSVYVTKRGTDVYVYLYADPMADLVELPPIETPPKSVTLLNSGVELLFKPIQGTKYWRHKMDCSRVCELPIKTNYHHVMVLKLSYDRLPKTFADPRTGDGMFEEQTKAGQNDL